MGGRNKKGDRQGCREERKEGGGGGGGGGGEGRRQRGSEGMDN